MLAFSLHSKKSLDYRARCDPLRHNNFALNVLVSTLAIRMNRKFGRLGIVFVINLPIVTRTFVTRIVAGGDELHPGTCLNRRFFTEQKPLRGAYFLAFFLRRSASCVGFASKSAG